MFISKVRHQSKTYNQKLSFVMLCFSSARILQSIDKKSDQVKQLAIEFVETKTGQEKRSVEKSTFLS